MSEAAKEKVVHKAIETRTFEPVYYLYGDDDFRTDDAMRRLVDAAADPATRDFNVEILRASEVDAETLGSLLTMPPMMAERRVVAVRDVGALKKDARAVLDRYVRSPAPDVLLVLTSIAGSKADKALCAQTAAVEFAPLSGARLPKWITWYAEHELGTTISAEAVSLLQDAVGSDLAQLKIELDKLASYTNGKPIDEGAVSEIVGVRKGETLGALLDAVGDRDAARALALIPTTLQQPKTSAVQIVLALSTQTLALAWGRAKRDRGTSASRLGSEYYDLLKESGGSYTGRSWGDAVRCWVRAVDHWTGPELDAALEALLDADAALKESRLSSDEQLLTNLVLALCGSGKRRAA
jgi:DNA polymerase III subunit delta